MATPTHAINKDRTFKKIIAILFFPAKDGAARETEQRDGHADISKAKTQVYICAGVPTAGTGVADNAICLDTTNDNVYRYYDSAWDMINVTT